VGTAAGMVATATLATRVGVARGAGVERPRLSPGAYMKIP